MRDAFVIAQGTMHAAQNLFVRVRLAGGATGYGEVAPFTALTGEHRAASERACRELAERLLGKSAARYRAVSRQMQEERPGEPAARCGLETALLDALCRAAGIPMWAWWGGGASGPLETDVTIPILPLPRALELARQWYGRGFRAFKLKIGAQIEADVERVLRIAEACPEVRFLLDANQGFTPDEAVAVLHKLHRLGERVLLFEQPVAKNDIQGLASVRARSTILISADEAVATVADARRVIEASAADVINLKITKSGLLETLDIATMARTAGLKLTIGGMVETRLAMGCSLAIALGWGDLYALDLDTPLLLAEDPLVGGYRYEGPRMTVWQAPGLGMEPRAPASRG